MGQKTKPLGFRLGINRTWDSRWLGTKLYADQLHKDLKEQHLLQEQLFLIHYMKELIKDFIILDLCFEEKDHNLVD